MNVKQSESQRLERWAVAPAALSTKQGRGEHTYDFGFGDESHGFGPAISNGRVIDSRRRRRIYHDRIRFIKL